MFVRTELSVHKYNRVVAPKSAVMQQTRTPTGGENETGGREREKESERGGAGR